MSDLAGLFRAFCATKAWEMNFQLPVKAELADISTETFLQATFIGWDELGFCQFEDEKALAGTLWKQAPFLVRLTPQGQRAYTFDFPWPLDGAPPVCPFSRDPSC